MTRKLIVNADDFGFNTKINKGIIDAHKNGVVTSVSITVTKEGFTEAVSLARENLRLGVGLHLDLDSFFSIDHPRGIVSSDSFENLLLSEIEQEIRKQIGALKSAGINPDHITSHHQTHLVQQVFPIVCKIMKENNIHGIRFSKRIYKNEQTIQEMKAIIEQNGLITTSHFIEGWYWGNIDENFSVAELMTHPGYGEIWREYELSACCDPKLKNYIFEKNIQLITFKDLLQTT